jgi:DNA (cytosine-5)-methyltransferase 1
MALSAFDAFAGCGGLSLGLTQAGISVVGACESDKWASDTFARNHVGTRLHRCGVEELTSGELRRDYGGIDLLAGGPPCQGFSVSGKRQYGLLHEKNILVYEYLRLCKTLRPRMFVLENVRGFQSATVDGRARALNIILRGLTELGYHINHQILYAPDYGVPQFRSRLFVIGSLEPLVLSPFPIPTHGVPGLPHHRGCLEAISDLPTIDAGQGSDGYTPYDKTPEGPLQRALRAGSKGVFNHQAMNHTPRLVDRFRATPPGGKSYDLGRRRDRGEASIVTVYKSNNQRLIGDRPSLCITANFQSNYVHPVRHRNLTAREAARLQTFPDSFVFCGRRTLMSSSLLKQEGRDNENHLSQYNQIGNAVPPLLARLIGEQIQEVISRGPTPTALPDRNRVQERLL